ncbi:MAG: hypothetical protein EZS28_006288 [Streblomastix strix]|uniref:Uncharacterized protein n=1 Tax=Streblomastix strix TaxID=222440 RepID=A0A5J4WT09_9EUKA|nr:MAG: hypothetical protein EZS28_006288 [Streblomastix strix]
MLSNVFQAFETVFDLLCLIQLLKVAVAFSYSLLSSFPKGEREDLNYLEFREVGLGIAEENMYECGA